MSFIERHKAWLLPLLGAGVLGVVYMNVRMLGGPAPAPAQEGVPAPAQAAATAPSAPAPQAPAGTAQDLWKDLRVLETPPAPLADVPGLLSLGARAQDWGAPVPKASLHPDRWPRASAPGPAAVSFREEPPPPLPQVVFVDRTPSGPVVWIEQRPYREGERLPSGYRVARITLDRVRFEWAGKALERTLVPLNAPPKEAP